MKNTAQFFFLIAVSCLVSCASTKRPHFQKVDASGFGYKIEDGKTKSMFTITTLLPEKIDAKFSISYGARAIAEECLVRGYPYFDFGVVTPHELQGYCYKTIDHPGLGVEFTDRGLTERPQHFVVGSLNGKTKTQLKEKDELLEIEGAPVASLAQLKSTVATASADGRKELNLTVKRGDGALKDTLKIKEPIALFKNSSMGSSQLDLLRERVP